VAGRAPRTSRVYAALWLAPVVFTLVLLGVYFAAGHFLLDFKGGLYGAGEAILHGRNPYDPGYFAHQAALQHAGGKPETIIYLPVYPAPALLAATPFALLPYPVAGVLFALLSIGALMLSLRLLGVSDWRCYALAFAPWPVMHGFLLGALTPLLCLGVAAAWYYRNHLLAPAVAVAAVVVAKLFLWPLVLWLAFTRRLRAAALAVAIGVSVTAAAWAAIGFDGLREYPRMLSDLASISEGVGVSPVSALLAMGIGAGAAKAVALGLALALIGLGWHLRKGLDGDRRFFVLAVTAGLVSSPMVWPHYLALLVVIVALASPRFSLLWLVPLVSYLAPIDQLRGRTWPLVPYLGMVAVVTVWAVLRDPRAPARLGSWRPTATSSATSSQTAR
jgi:hypothetical protein